MTRLIDISNHNIVALGKSNFQDGQQSPPQTLLHPGTAMTTAELDNIISNYKDWMKKQDLEEDRAYKLVISQKRDESGLHYQNESSSASLLSGDISKIGMPSGTTPTNQYVKNWSVNDSKRFQEAIELFKDQQLNTKKIAKYMGEHIDPMRIRLEKIKYQKDKRRANRETQQQIVQEVKNYMGTADWVAEVQQSVSGNHLVNEESSISLTGSLQLASTAQRVYPQIQSSSMSNVN